MDSCFLGRTGLKVSKLCLGCMTFSQGADERTSHKILDYYLGEGGNFLDTSNNYNESEVYLGNWIKNQRREQVVLASKVRFPVGKGLNDLGLSRKHILAAVNKSLERLHTEYLDLYIAHVWDHITPLEETMRAFEDLITSGKVRYIGASNFTGWQLMKSLAVSDSHEWNRFVCLQMQYNLLVRSPEWELIPLCKEEGLGIMVWSPLAAGWLTGKYAKNRQPSQESRFGSGIGSEKEWRDLLEVTVQSTIPFPYRAQSEEELTRIMQIKETERRWQIIDAVADIAKENGKTSAQIALSWVLSQPAITTPVIGARTVEQLEENLGCLGWNLTPDQLVRLDKVSSPGLPYPYDFIKQYALSQR